MELKIKPLSPKIGAEIPLPAYATAGSAGMDLRACIDGPLTVPGAGRPAPREGLTRNVKVPTGIAIAIPQGYVGLVFARSGLAVNHGITPANCVGVIDSDYRGEVVVGLQNSGWEDHIIQPGDRIAQLVIMPVVQARPVVVDALDATARGEGGFGSTGRA